MIKLNNYISKIFYEDKDEFNILSVVDLNYFMTDSEIVDYVTKCSKHSFFNKKIVKINNELFKKEVQFNLKDYYSIKSGECDLKLLINEKFNTELKWKFLFYRNKKLNKTRILFKIDHAYADGYQIINILFEKEDLTTKFKRKTSENKMYYFLYGTIYLFYVFIKCILSCLIPKKYETGKTDFIQFKSLSLKKIKQNIPHHMTINDFLYSLMIKTDKLYFHERDVYTVSSINVSKTQNDINITPLFLKINNSGKDILNEVHELFNSCKYSLFIPGLTYFLNFVTGFLNDSLLFFLYKSVLSNVNYTYSNMIGPSLNKKPHKILSNIENIKFLSTAKNNEICYNIFSCKDNVNIICSFKEGTIADKPKYIKCLYAAYNELCIEGRLSVLAHDYYNISY